MEKNELKVKLFYDRILTTVKTRKVTEGGIILSSNKRGEPLTRQTVVAAGTNSNVTVGQEIEINFDAFPRVKTENAPHDIGPDKYTIALPIEIIDGKEYFFISSRELKWAYDD